MLFPGEFRKNHFSDTSRINKAAVYPIADSSGAKNQFLHILLDPNALSEQRAGLYNGVAPDIVSVSNAPATMFKTIAQFFSATSGHPAGAGPEFHPEHSCLECCSPLMRSEAFWQCPNQDCPVQIRKRIAHWCSPNALNITGADTPLIALLVRHGLVRDAAELYRLKTAELAALPGMDADCSRLFVDSVAASRQCEPSRILFGLFIPGLGVEHARNLCDQFVSVNEILTATAHELEQTQRIPPPLADSIARWWEDGVNRRVVRRLLKADLKING